ncbi:hypothetical protein BC830DRAFT_1174673 [Chytriomyces sp. MP71]|nr:hypothetical protein BC830DRAFT_1174673 [Chytriomyces sp. MP71]
MGSYYLLIAKVINETVISEDRFHSHSRQHFPPRRNPLESPLFANATDSLLPRPSRGVRPEVFKDMVHVFQMLAQFIRVIEIFPGVMARELGVVKKERSANTPFKSD